MIVNIFFSWQSETPGEYNTEFISGALKKAVKLLKKQNKKIEFADLHLDRDTKNVPGSPNIPVTLDNKIRACQIFVADLTVTNKNNTFARLIPDSIIAPRFNANVTYELGKAEAIVSSKAVITVFNTHYHAMTESTLPFDIRQNRWPIRYHYSKKQKNKRENISDDLANALAERIKLIIEDGIKNPQSPYYPFLEWDQWTRELGENLNIDYETNETVNGILKSVTKGCSKERAVLRLVGLSGLGKTRLTYEAFNPIRDQKNLPIARDILYLDLNTAPDFRDQLFRLSENGERKILICDNCDRQSLADIAPLVKKSTSKLSLIAIDHNVPVSVLDQDSESVNINLKHEDFESIIDDILLKVFPGADDAAERTLIKQFAKGHTLIATILAQDKKQQKTNWRPIITRTGVLEKILGEFGTRPEERKVLRAVSIFDKLGHYEELLPQTEFVANSELLSNLTPGSRVDAFKQVCRHYLTKGIMEKQARYLIIRTRPIALSLAVEWWEQCDSDMAKRVFESMENQHELKVSLTEQLKYLDFLDNARDVVEKFVKPTGPFGIAEVLNTEEGSRLFRAFVEVNPQATTQALERIFQHKSKDDLLQIDRGRRNLIWALEKLCFRADTFEKAVKVLLNFSVAENEEISNNARGQFLQLFQAFLPGTQADYNSRIQIIEYALTKGPDFEELGFYALLRGLKARDFHRGGGAEDQGSGPPLKDFPHTDEDAAKVLDYWKYCIDRVLQFALGESQFSGSAREVLINSIRAFSSVGAAHLILPPVEHLLTKDTSDWYEVRSNLKLTLKYEKHSLGSDNKDFIDKLLSRINPQDFESLYTQFVKSPRWDDEDTFDNMRIRAQQLAVTFVEKEYDLKKYLSLFYQGEQQNGGWFGEEIANCLNDGRGKEFFEQSIGVLHLIEKEKYNLVVLIGFIKAIKNQNEKIDFIRAVINDQHFKSLTFQVAAMSSPPAPIFDDLVSLVKSKEFPVSEFTRFQYGRALDHLSSEDVLRIFSEISDHSIEGTKTAISVLYMYCYNNETNWTISKNLIRKLLHTKHLLEYTEDAELDKHKWGDLCEKFLKTSDVPFAIHIMEEIISLSDSNTFVSSVDFELKSILKLLMKDYFDAVWPKLSTALLSVDEKFMVYYNLKNLLTSHINSYGPDKGVLFLGDLDEILKWCRNNQPLAPNRLANMVPIFHETVPAKWHPFTLRLIDEFGDNDDFINKLDANMNSYSWTGSIVPLLRDKKTIIELLNEHKFQKIREWAQANSIRLDEAIRRETHEDVERYL
jgi:hypothetical protein